MPHDCAEIELNSELIYFLPLSTLLDARKAEPKYTPIPGIQDTTGCQKSRSVGCFLKMSPVSAVWNDTACILGKHEKDTIQPVFRHTVYDFGTSYRTGSN